MSEGVGGRAALAEALFRTGALRLGRFTLARGRIDPYRLDLSALPSDPEAFALAVAAYQSVAKKIGAEEFDAVAGVATAGLVFSSPLAYVLKKPLLCVHGEEKGRGPAGRVEGAVRPGWRVLVVNDLVASGEGTASAAEALRSSGCVVREALALIDRLEGGKRNLAARGVRSNSFTDIRELAETLFESRRITKADHQAVLRRVEGSSV